MSVIERKFAIWLVLLLTVSAALRIYGLGTPYEMMFDETHYVPAAQVMGGLKDHPGMGAWSSHRLIGRSPDVNFSHPPAGKLLIALSMVLFGDHPFGWRILSALAGVLAVWIMVLIGKRLGLTPAAQLLLGWLIASDGLHLTISRLAMLDSFLFLFALMSVHGVLLCRRRAAPAVVVYIAASLGAALATKESALNVVAAVMLLQVFFGSPALSIKQRLILSVALGAGSLAFYGLSGFYYIGHGFSPLEWVQFRAEVITKLVNPLAEHRYGSSPWQWLIAQKPVWIYWKDFSDKIIGIVATGNLIFWWLFLPAGLLVLYRILRRREGIFCKVKGMAPGEWAGAFGMVWFVGLTVPVSLMVARRVGFLYHHLPAIAPMAVVLAGVVDASPSMLSGKSLGRFQHFRPIVLCGVFIATLIQLLVFLPVLLGLPMSRAMYEFLRIFTGV